MLVGNEIKEFKGNKRNWDLMISFYQVDELKVRIKRNHSNLSVDIVSFLPLHYNQK